MNNYNKQTYSGVPELPDGDLWIFAYGSLLWRPGFEYIQGLTAKIYGYHRKLCVWSRVHRGTAQQPGLVFGLDHGGCCVGRVFRVAAESKAEVLEYLCERELVTNVYSTRLIPAYTEKGVYKSLAFVVRRDHPQYAQDLDVETTANVIRRGSGLSGHNIEYFIKAVEQLQKLGIPVDRYKEIDSLI